NEPRGIPINVASSMVKLAANAPRCDAVVTVAGSIRNVNTNTDEPGTTAVPVLDATVLPPLDDAGVIVPPVDEAAITVSPVEEATTMLPVDTSLPLPLPVDPASEPAEEENEEDASITLLPVEEEDEDDEGVE